MHTHQNNPPYLCTVISRKPEDTHELARIVATYLNAGNVIALIGELGAGKTQFVRGLADGLGLNPLQVSSPTFVIVQEYEFEETEKHQQKLESLIHIDAYRINDLEELTSIGWELTENITNDGQVQLGGEIRDNRILIIEWADLIESHLPAETLWIVIEHRVDENDPEQPSRFIHIHGHQPWHPLKSLENAVILEQES